MKFQIKDKVVPKDHLKAHTNYMVLEVVGYLDGAVLTMHWGDGFGEELHHYDFLEDTKPGDRSWRGAIQRYQEEELLTPEEALAELRKLEDKKSKLEAEFESVRNKVQEKMSQAAVFVKEASALVDPTGKDFYDLAVECKELYLALNEGGWSHSTMRCKYGR